MLKLTGKKILTILRSKFCLSKPMTEKFINFMADHLGQHLSHYTIFVQKMLSAYYVSRLIVSWKLSLIWVNIVCNKGLQSTLAEERLREQMTSLM